MDERWSGVSVAIYRSSDNVCVLFAYCNTIWAALLLALWLSCEVWGMEGTDGLGFDFSWICCFVVETVEDEAE